MGKFLQKLMGAPEVKPLLSDEHFSVDGTLPQAWASHASLERMMVRRIHRLPLQGRVRDSVPPGREKSEQKGT